MKLEKITLDPVTPPAHAKTILAQEGFRCSLLTLAPGDETPLQEARDVEEHLLFVIEGEATVRRGEVHTMLGKDQALLIAQGQAHVLSAGASGWARLLRIDVPPRQIVTPQIVTLPR